MSSYQVPQDTEWCFDGAAMPDFATSPLAHRSVSASMMEIIDPQDYYQRVVTGPPDAEQCMDGNYLVNPHLVSPASIMPCAWTNDLNSNQAMFGRGTAAMAGFTAAHPLATSMSMSSLRTPAPMFSPLPQSGLVSALAARRANNQRQLGHRSSLSEHQTVPKTPLQISTNRHHRSRSSVHSFVETPALFSPFSTMSRSLSTTSSATDLSDLLVSPSRPTNSRKTSAKSARSLAPKAADMIEPTGAANMVRIKSLDGTSREVGVLPRTPKHAHNRSQGTQKLLCDNCNEVPDGFRGEHELMRHFNLRHAPRRKAFICIEPPGQEGFFAQVGCRSCKDKKLYGAYYNAAAHLRRVHFDPRPRGRKAKGTERRGGKAGGNNPPMDVLKTHWIREVDVANTNHSALQSRNLADTEEFDEESNEDDFELPHAHSSHTGSRTCSTSSRSTSSGDRRAGSDDEDDDEATLLSSSINGDAIDTSLPSFDLPATSQAQLTPLPYPPFPISASSTTAGAAASSIGLTSSNATSIDSSSPMAQDPLSSPLSWHATLTSSAAGASNGNSNSNSSGGSSSMPFTNDAAGSMAWSDAADPHGMMMAQLSPGFESLDSAFSFIHQQPDLFMGPWS